ncbi:hypothetical protein BH20ACI2_BH20ACI2_21280 [soil metagenome]
MTSTSIFCGAILILIGLIGYLYGSGQGSGSATALIPAAFGVVLILCGVIGAAKEGLRKHTMHAAVAVALLGFIMVVGRLAMRLSSLTMSAAVISQIAMAIVCLIFVLAGVSSFARARSERLKT